MKHSEDVRGMYKSDLWIHGVGPICQVSPKAPVLTIVTVGDQPSDQECAAQIEVEQEKVFRGLVDDETISLAGKVLRDSPSISMFLLFNHSCRLDRRRRRLAVFVSSIGYLLLSSLTDASLSYRRRRSRRWSRLRGEIECFSPPPSAAAGYGLSRSAIHFPPFCSLCSWR